MIKIFIGPNGYGKTTKLNSERNELINEQEILESNILFLPSELLLLDEMKDTKDGTQAMEFILTEILETDEIRNSKESLEQLIDSQIEEKQDELNEIVNSVLAYNEEEREKNFIETTSKKEYKKVVKIDSTDIKDKMGSGQRLHILLELIKKSSKEYIFLDEPEKYSHPSLLNKTALLINELNSINKNVYIATHSAKLLSMLDLAFENIYILNDKTYEPKSSIFRKVIVPNSIKRVFKTLNKGFKYSFY